MIKGQLIKFDYLPSKGVTYPKDVEIYVKPYLIMSEMATSDSRFSVSKAGYYEELLEENIEIRGSGLAKEDLLFCDVQLIDLVRRLYTFITTEKITVKDCLCLKCGKKAGHAQFLLADLRFTNIDEAVYDKIYEFSDGMQVKVEPIKIGDFIRISRKYLSNAVKKEDGELDIRDYITASYTCNITEVIDREYESKEAREKFLFEYISSLYKNLDKRIIKEIDRDTISIVEPFTIICDSCGKETEVYVEPSMNFWQE